MEQQHDKAGSDIQDSLEERVNDYLTGFKSENAANSPGPTGKALVDALDNFLLERAAEELRQAKERLDTLQQKLGKKIEPGEFDKL